MHICLIMIFFSVWFKCLAGCIHYHPPTPILYWIHFKMRHFIRENLYIFWPCILKFEPLILFMSQKTLHLLSFKMWVSFWITMFMWVRACFSKCKHEFSCLLSFFLFGIFSFFFFRLLPFYFPVFVFSISYHKSCLPDNTRTGAALAVTVSDEEKQIYLRWLETPSGDASGEPRADS